MRLSARGEATRGMEINSILGWSVGAGGRVLLTLDEDPIVEGRALASSTISVAYSRLTSLKLMTR